MGRVVGSVKRGVHGAPGTSRCECGHDWEDHGGAVVFGSCSLCDCNYFDDGLPW